MGWGRISLPAMQPVDMSDPGTRHKEQLTPALPDLWKPIPLSIKSIWPITARTHAQYQPIRAITGCIEALYLTLL